MAGKPKKSPEELAALDKAFQERKETELVQMEGQAQREALIAQCHEVIGRIQATDAIGKFGTVSNLLWMRDMKQMKIYRDLPNIGTWDKFCKYIGKDTRTVDENLQNLEVFGQDFLETVSNLRVGYRELRQLRKLTNDGALVIDDEAVEIAGERVPLNSDHKDDIQVLLDRILEDKNKQVEDARAEARAKERVLEDKSKRIQRLEREVDELKEKSFIPTDEADFIKELDLKRLTFEEMYMRSLEDTADIIRRMKTESPTGKAPARMEAAFVATIYFLRSRVAGLWFDCETEFTDFRTNPDALADFDRWQNETYQVDPKYLGKQEG